MEILNKIQKQLKAPKGQKNTFGNYKYRSCEDILEAVKPLLGEATLILSDEIVCIGLEPTTIGEITEEYIIYNNKIKETKYRDIKKVINGSRFYVKATATLQDGKDSISVSAFARESFEKKGMDASQITGASSSYARKYALNGLFCIDDTKDSDTQDNREVEDTGYHETVQTLIDNARKGIASPISEYQKIVNDPEALHEVNEAKKEFNRSQYKPKKVAEVKDDLKGL
jgi:hypothetical protein